MSPNIRDSSWVRQSFLVNANTLEKIDQQNRFFSSAALKFTDTSPGGNFCINPLPQFTKYADLPPPTTSRSAASDGMGRYYSEAIDDNNRLIYMRFGVPAYNSLTTFFSGFYNGEAGRLARTGRSTDLFYELGRAAGFVVSVMSWKLVAVTFLGMVGRFALEKPSTKYYYLKPAMPLYWNAFQTIINDIAVKKGVVPRVWGKDNTNRPIADQYEFDQEGINKLSSLMPDVFSDGGSINVYAMANKAQRLARLQEKLNMQMLSDAQFQNIGQAIVALNNPNNKLTEPGRPTTGSFHEYLRKYLSSGFGNVGAGDAGTSTNPSGAVEVRPTDPGFWSQISDFFEAELDDGSAFICYRVDSGTSISESFSNSVGESDIQNKINGLAASGRASSFSFANGNISDNLIAQTVEGALGAAKSFVSGALDGIGMSGLAVLAGGAFVDIPKHWQNSVADLPKATYTIKLHSPYNNPISQLINIYVPLAGLLAGALPLSTGPQSYTSPFLVEYYDKGRCQTRLGIIDSLSITRGTGNTGWTSDGHALGIDVSFTIIDMSSVLHMPISEGVSWNNMATGVEAGSVIGIAAGALGTKSVIGAAAGGTVAAAGGAAVGGAVDVVGNVIRTVNGIFSDDNAFSDYMSVLSGVSLSDQIYPYRKLKLRLTKALTDWKSMTHPAAFASFAGDLWPARLVSSVYKGVER